MYVIKHNSDIIFSNFSYLTFNNIYLNVTAGDGDSGGLSDVEIVGIAAGVVLLLFMHWSWHSLYFFKKSGECCL